jgi:hypothetical protein
MRAIVFAIATVVATAQGVSGNAKRPACVDLGIARAYTSNWGAITLEQHDCRVTGTYDGGRLTGTLDGNVIRYAWTSGASSAGRGVFVLATTGELIGTWGNGASEIDGGGWNLAPDRELAR